MSWVAVAIGGSAVVSGVLGSRSADRAADAQVESSDAAIAEQRRQYDQTRQDLMPYAYGGGQAFNDILGEFGYQPYQPPAQTTTTNQPPNYLSQGPYAGQTANINGLDIPLEWFTGPPQATPVQQGQSAQPVNPPAPGIGFQASPDYEFRRDEGTRDINNSFAARGGALSGNALRALTEYNSNLASQEYGNWFERRARVAGIGGSATNVGAQIGANTAGNIGNALIGQGNARASGITGGASAINNAVQGGVGNWLLYRNTRNA